MSTVTSLPASMFPEGEATFQDGFGARCVGTDPATGDRLERLRLSAELARQVSAVEDRVGRLLNFRHARFPRVRGVEVEHRRDGTAEVWVVADPVDGIRVIDLLRLSEAGRLSIDVNTILQLVREVLPALATLHDSRDVTHGAIGPERLVLTPQGRVMIADHAFGAALAKLQYPRVRLWRDFRIAMPPAAGVPRFDARADVAMVATTALALLLGRPITLNEYPDHLRAALELAREHLGGGADRPLSASLRTWLERTLPIDTRKPLSTALQAQVALDEAIKKERAYAPGGSALRHFLERVGPVLVGANWDKAPGAGPAQGDTPDVPASRSPVAPSRKPAARNGTRAGPRRLTAEEEEAEEIAYLERELARMAAEDAAAKTAKAPGAGPGVAAAVGDANAATTDESTGLRPVTQPLARQAAGTPTAEASATPQPGSAAADEDVVELTSMLDGLVAAGRDAAAPGAPAAARQGGDLSATGKPALTLVPDERPVSPPAGGDEDEHAQPAPAPAPRRGRGRSHKPRAHHPGPETAPQPAGGGDPGRPAASSEHVSGTVTGPGPTGVGAGGVTDALAVAAQTGDVVGTVDGPAFAGSLGVAVVQVISEIPRRLPSTPVIEIVEFDESQALAVRGVDGEDEAPDEPPPTPAAEDLDDGIAPGRFELVEVAYASPVVPPPGAGRVDAVPLDGLPAGALLDDLWSPLAFHPAAAEHHPPPGPPAAVGAVDAVPADAVPREALDALIWSALAFHPAAVTFQPPVEAPARAGVVDPVPVEAIPLEALEATLWSAVAFQPASAEYRRPAEAPAIAGVVDPLPAAALTSGLVPDDLWSGTAYHPASAEHRRPGDPPSVAGVVDPLPIDALTSGLVPDDLWSGTAYHPASAEHRRPDEPPRTAGVVDPLPTAALTSGTVPDDLWSALALQPADVERQPPVEAPAHAGVVDPVPAAAVPARAREAAVWSALAYQPGSAEYRRPPPPPASAGIVDPVPAHAVPPAVLEGELWSAAAFQPADVEYRRPVEAPAVAGVVDLAPEDAQRPEVLDGVLWAAAAFHPAFVEFRPPARAPGRAGVVQADPEAAHRQEVVAGTLWAPIAFQPASVESRAAIQPPRQAGKVDPAPDDLTLPSVADGTLWSSFAYQLATADHVQPAPPPAAVGIVDADPGDAARPEVVEGILWSGGAFQPGFVAFQAPPPAPDGVGAVDPDPADAARPEVAKGILWSAGAYQPAFAEYRLVSVPAGIGAIDPGPDEAVEAAQGGSQDGLAVSDVPAAGSPDSRERGPQGVRGEPRAEPAHEVRGGPVEPQFAAPVDVESVEATELDEDEEGEDADVTDAVALEPEAPDGARPYVREAIPAAVDTSPPGGPPVPEHAPWLTADPLPPGASEFRSTSWPTAPALPAGDCLAPDAAEAAVLVPVASAVVQPVAPGLRFLAPAEPPVGIRLAPPADPLRPSARAALDATPAVHLSGDPAALRDLPLAGMVLPPSPDRPPITFGAPLSGMGEAPGSSGWWRPLAASLTVVLLTGAALGGYWYLRPSADRQRADQQVSEEAKPIPVAKGGRVRITSTPAGARVRLDGQDRGVTPLELAEVVAGTHVVVLASESGVVRKTVRVTDGETAEVDASIFSGWLTVFAPFRVKLYLNGTLLGTSEDGKLLIPSGTHQLELVNDALGVRETRSVEISPGGTTPLSFQAPDGQVQVDAPPGAELWVDGELKGTAPTGPIAVPVGTHEVVVRHPDLSGRPLAVQVVANRVTRIPR